MSFASSVSSLETLGFICSIGITWLTEVRLGSIAVIFPDTMMLSDSLISKDPVSSLILTERIVSDSDDTTTALMNLTESNRTGNSVKSVLFILDNADQAIMRYPVAGNKTLPSIL